MNRILKRFSSYRSAHKKNGLWRTLVSVCMHSVLLSATGVSVYTAIVWRNFILFVGVALLLSGFLNFSSGRYCDGNVADYYTCTRPTTYYYFDGFTIALVIVGVFFVMLWFLKRARK